MWNIQGDEKQGPRNKAILLSKTFKIGEIKTFPDTKKTKEFVNTKPELQQQLKGLLYEEEEKEKGEPPKTQSNNKMAPHTKLSIITLNVNGLNAPAQNRG